MFHLAARGLLAFVGAGCVSLGVAHAADPLPAETRLVAAANAPAPSQFPFSIAAAQDLTVTLTDLKVPAELVSAGIVVTQAGAVSGSAQLTAPATSATFSLPAASGNYTMYVYGVPNASFSVGTFSACVAPKASPSSCIQTASFSGNITAESTAKDPTVSTLSATLTVATGGAYTFKFADLNFPVALNSAPQLALFQGSAIVQLGITSGMSLNLSPGAYTLLAIAQADQTLKAGLYGIRIAGAAGTLFDSAIPVGLTSPAQPFHNPTAQAVTVKVTDYAFPSALAGASALLTTGGLALATASAGGAAMNAAAPAGTLYLWTHGQAGATPGTYSADVSAAGVDLYLTAEGVTPTGSSTFAYAFVTPTPLTAGMFQAAAADLQFPSQLTGLAFAIAQHGTILQQSATAGSVAFTATAAQGVLLVSAQTPASGGTSGNGLFDVNIQTTGASPQLIFDKTQAVSSTPDLLDSQTLTLGASANFDASLTDLKVPVAFDDLALVISSGSQILGKIYGGGVFTFAGAPGTYQLTFVATPSALQQFGLYAVSIVYSPPTVTLTSSVTSVTTGSTATLTWSSTNSSSCTASGGSWTGSQPTSGTLAVTVQATTTYSLTCTGTGGNAAQSVSVTATPAPSSGGGGSLDIGFLTVGGMLVGRRLRGARRGSHVRN